MLKMFRFVLVVTLALALIIPFTGALAKDVGEKAVRATYYSTTDPGTTSLGEAPWEGPLPPTGNTIMVAAGDSIWFGCDNFQVDSLWKEWWLRLKGVNVFSLGVGIDSVLAYDSEGSSAAYSYSKVGKSFVPDGGVTFNVKIKPQPEWEVIVLRNDGSDPVTITDVLGETKCHRDPEDTPIPSLTTYGIIVLVLLLLASTVWVIRKKRAHVPA